MCLCSKCVDIHVHVHVYCVCVCAVRRAVWRLCFQRLYLSLHVILLTKSLYADSLLASASSYMTNACHVAN